MYNNNIICYLKVISLDKTLPRKTAKFHKLLSASNAAKLHVTQSINPSVTI